MFSKYGFGNLNEFIGVRERITVVIVQEEEGNMIGIIGGLLAADQATGGNLGNLAGGLFGSGQPVGVVQYWEIWQVQTPGQVPKSSGTKNLGRVSQSVYEKAKAMFPNAGIYRTRKGRHLLIGLTSSQLEEFQQSVKEEEESSVSSSSSGTISKENKIAVYGAIVVGVLFLFLKK